MRDKGNQDYWSKRHKGTRMDKGNKEGTWGLEGKKASSSGKGDQNGTRESGNTRQ